jgi:hypothetical protein
MSSVHTNWGDMPDTKHTRKVFPHLADCLVAGLFFMQSVFGWGPSLTSFSNSTRPIRNGSRPSAHNKGAALDIRYYTDPTGRYSSHMIDTTIRPSVLANLQILIDRADELGIQQIHDYYGDRVWSNTRTGDGWRDQNGRGQGMGERWATYFHIECNYAAWGVDTPWAELLGLDNGPAGTPWPRFDPERRMWGLWPVNTDKKDIRSGSRGDEVLYAQGLLRSLAYISNGQLPDPGPIDGRFGQRTERTTVAYQVSKSTSLTPLKPDGIIGPATWRHIDADALLMSAEATG